MYNEHIQRECPVGWAELSTVCTSEIQLAHPARHSRKYSPSLVIDLRGGDVPMGEQTLYLAEPARVGRLP